jgi:uncharacterized protein YndB with AHSA1/START domain
MATTYHVSRRINAPADRVWEILTDTAKYRDWNRAVVSIEGTIGLGNTISLVSIVNPNRTFRLHITEMSRPHRLVWSDGMRLGLFKGERTYRLDERDGATEFSMTEAFSGLLAGAFTKAIPDLTESFNLFADSLKTVAEAPRPA